MTVDRGDTTPAIPTAADVTTKAGNNESLDVNGYVLDRRRQYLAYLLSVLSLGILQLLFYWRPDWRLRMSHKASHCRDADAVLIVDCYKLVYVENIKTHEAGTAAPEAIRYFIHKKLKYIWDAKANAFELLGGYVEGVSCSELHASATGLSKEQQQQRACLYDDNLIKVNVRPVIWLILHEALNPFYVFQLYTSVVWFIQNYVLYTAAVFILAFVSIGVTVYETRKQSKKLRNSVKSSSEVRVYRGSDDWESVNSMCLVPGDVIEVTSQTTMECDAVLLNGSVVVNESMLTGESVPVTKMALPNTSSITFKSPTHKKQMLFCGTDVLMTHGQHTVRALVVRTGFATAKGELVRSILFPKPVDMKFYSDSMRFLWVSFALGILAMIYTTVFYTLNKSPIKEIVISALDIITFVIPPSLPATITIGNIYAQKRLKKQGMFCLSSKFINLTGTLNMVCFDKTGTLTHDGLDLEGVLPVEDKSQRLGELQHCAHHPDLLHAMVTCHSLIKLDGQETGDPLDMVMFQSTSWHTVEPSSVPTPHATFPVSRLVQDPHGDRLLSIVHQFPFLSDLQRMSVIVEDLTDGHSGVMLYMKGAPETVVKHCMKSAVPENLEDILDQYTSKGYRVIALACRRLGAEELSWSLQDIQRQDLECGLSLLGLVVLQNRLKPQSAPAIHCLRAASIRSVMVTGDNLRTAVHTASCCGIIDPDTQEVIIISAQPNKAFTHVDIQYQPLAMPHPAPEQGSRTDTKLLVSRTECFAMEGATYMYLKALRPELLSKLVQRGVVFARMLPELKVRLIQHYQELGYLVGMCGDGANDCGALKTANTGISLSTAEASVASPFTSTTPNIQCVPTLLKEGRCALVSSFGLFKFLLACSWIFCIAVLILYKISCDMTDKQYLYSDMILVVLPGLFIADIAAYPTLVKFPPPPTLTRLSTITSLIGYIVTQTIFLAGLWEFTRRQPWFEAWVNDVKNPSNDKYESYENTIIFHSMSLSFAYASIIFCQGPPYRKRFYSNKIYTAIITFINIASIAILIYPPDFVLSVFSLKRLPVNFCLLVFLISVTNLFISLLFEDIFVNIYIHRHFLPWLRKKLGHKHEFERVEEEIADDPTWPPYSSTNQKRDDVTSCNGVADTVSEDTMDTMTWDDVRLRGNRGKSAKNPGHRHSAVLESSFALLNTNSIGTCSMSLPDIDSEVESLKTKQWNRRSYIQEANCY